jgi:large subunit ribosomal protein L3
MRAGLIEKSKKKFRTGLIARKVGMTSIFAENGNMVPVTFLQVEDAHVVSNKTVAVDGYNAVQIGVRKAKAKNVTKPLKGHYAKANVESLSKLKEFVVSEDALIAVGTKLTVDHFVTGQYVDVQGITIGRGFTGAMKRHNFRGLEATHGVSLTHRSHGSTGANQDPGKVWKNKKMAGHYGVETVTIQNLQIIMVDNDSGLLVIKGAVPGHKGNYVFVKDAIKKALNKNVPYPTAITEQENVGENNES